MTHLASNLVTGSFSLRAMMSNVFADYYDVTVDLYSEMSSLSFHPVRHLVGMLSQIVFGFLGVFSEAALTFD